MVSFAVAGMISFLTSRSTHYMSTIRDPADINAKLNAMVSSFGDAFLLAAGIAIFAWLIVWTLKRPKVQATQNKFGVAYF